MGRKAQAMRVDHDRCNLEPYIGDRVPALFSILCETPADELFNSRVQVYGKSIQVRLAHEDGSERFRDSFGMECLTAREHLVEHAAEGKDVAALIGGVSLRLLRRHVAGGAEKDAATHGSVAEQRWRVRRSLGRRNLEHLGQAEVEDLDLSFWSDLHICRLQIAMNNTFFVRCFEPFTHVRGNIEDILNGNRTTLNAFGERFAFHQFEHEKSRLTGFLDVVNRCNVGMIERCKDFSLTPEPRHPTRLPSERLRENL